MNPAKKLTARPRISALAKASCYCWLAAATAITFAAGAPATSPDSPTVIARSSQLAVEGTESGDSLVLQIHRTTNGPPLPATGVSVAVDGKDEPVTRQPDGSYVVGGPALNNGDHTLDVIVPHDGIREILTGKWTVKESKASSGLLGDHKQMAWWILNVAVVLIAAIALSRRKT